MRSTSIRVRDLRDDGPGTFRNPQPASWRAVCSGAHEVRETAENAAAMNTPFAAARPRQAPEALRHPLDIDARAMRKKSTPGISSAKKWAAATARNCSISPLDV